MEIERTLDTHITPAARLTIYELMQHRLVDEKKRYLNFRKMGNPNTPSFFTNKFGFGLCFLLQCIYYGMDEDFPYSDPIYLFQLPELWSLKPKDRYFAIAGYWFNPADYNIRLAMLRIAIYKVKEVIENDKQNLATITISE